MLHKTVITAVERMIPTMAVTTADVAASPTAEALRLLRERQGRMPIVIDVCDSQYAGAGERGGA